MPGLPGYKGKAAIGADKIAEMGNWSISGQEAEMLEDTQFEDECKSYVPGRIDGGVVSYNGHYDPTDTDGQTALLTAYENKTQINSIRLYYGSGAADFFFCETDVTCEVQSIDDLGVDQSGLGTIGFSLKVSGNILKKATAVFDGTISFTEGNKRLTRTGGASFVTLGFVSGQILTVRGSTNNDGEYTIADGGVLSTYLVVEETLTDEASVTDTEVIGVT